MYGLEYALWGAGVLVGLYALVVAALVLAGRRSEARALVSFIPDCLVLFKRLLADPRVSRRHKLALGGMVAYLASPIDLVPDFVPVAGQLDDAVLVVLTLRYVLRGSGHEALAQNWPGPQASLSVLERAVGWQGGG